MFGCKPRCTGSKVNKNRRQCPCGSGKAMRQCCGQPSNPTKLALERSAELLAEAGMHAEAAQALAERAKLSPHNPMIWNDLGVESMAAGQPDAAYTAFLQAHKVFPDYPLPLYNLGRLAMGRCVEEQARQPSSAPLIDKSAKEAIAYLHESLARDPLLSLAHALLSSAYEIAGDDVQAKLHEQEASRLDPGRFVERKLTWLQRIPLLRRIGLDAARPSLPFVSSSGRHITVSAPPTT